MRAAIAKRSVADLEAAGVKMAELSMSAEPLAEEGKELKDKLAKMVCL